MPRRASQRKFGKSLKLHLAKQKKQKLKEMGLMYVVEKSGMDKFSSEVHRVHMELGGKLVNSLRIKTQFLDRLQSV